MEIECTIYIYGVSSVFFSRNTWNLTYICTALWTHYPYEHLSFIDLKLNS
jgi:hypothetical protein